MEKQLCHSGPCKYHGWLKLVEWCRHPEILEPIFPGRVSALKCSDGKCGCFVDFEAKVMPGIEPIWPMPADMVQILAEMSESLPSEYKNEEKSVKND